MEPVRLASQAELVSAIAGANNVRLTAFVLGQGHVLDALEGAAERGASVGVTLPGDHFARSVTDIRVANDRAARELRAAGAAVNYAGSAPPDGPLHAKLAVVDGVGYLNTRNWPDDGGDTIVRDADPADVAVLDRAIDLKPAHDDRLTTVKTEALQQETAFVHAAPRGAIDVETESFGPSPLADELDARALAGDHVRLMVVESDIHDRSRARLATLQQDGVEVRVNRTLSSEKAALAGTAAWVGSTNATAALPQQIDWGMVTDHDDVVGQLHEHYERQWAAAVPFSP